MLTCVAEATAAEDAVMAAQNDLGKAAPLRLSRRYHTTGEAVAELSGELDIASAEMAVSYVRDIIERHHGPVTVDLAAVTFCDAQGLAALVRMARYADQKDTPFRVASPRPPLIKIMRITGLDRRFLTLQASPPGRVLPD